MTFCGMSLARRAMPVTTDSPLGPCGVRRQAAAIENVGNASAEDGQVEVQTSVVLSGCMRGAMPRPLEPSLEALTMFLVWLGE